LLKLDSGTESPLSSEEIGEVDDVNQDYENRTDNNVNEYLDKKLIYKLIQETV
jgi:hypothetical protein